MELMFLSTSSKTPKLGWHSLRSRIIPGSSNYLFQGYFYIGEQVSNLHKLQNLCVRGSVAATIVQAKAELAHMLENDGACLPEVIVCETWFDFGEMQDLAQWLRRHPVLKSIPFVLDATGLSRAALDDYRRYIRPDEILLLSNCDEAMLGGKIEFLRRMKHVDRSKAAPMIEEWHPVKGPLRRGFVSKRIFDILISSFALLTLSPLMLLIALAIVIESRGPVFYISKRAGRGYRIFKFYKFRTMVNGADKKVKDLAHLNQYDANGGPVFFKINNDPRVTRVGKFLRNTSLDELPQLLNVLLGDMSLVGNRPLPLYEAAKLTTDDYAARFMAPAGITGLWQVKKRGTKEMSVEERISIDIDYAGRCSFATDLWIIVNTPSALLQKENV